jgi:hypothetical protein
MPLNPESASDIAKISPYLPCLVSRRLSNPFLFKKNAVPNNYLLNSIVCNFNVCFGRRFHSSYNECAFESLREILSDRKLLSRM